MSDYGGEQGEEFECEWPEEEPNDGNLEGPEVELQNTFYTADDKKKGSPQEALEMFETCIMLSESLGDEEVNYRFKSLYNIVALSARLGHLENMIAK